MGRFQVWTLESRTRYALAWGAINAATVGSLYVAARYSEISAGSTLRYLALGLVLGVLAHWFIWYPRALRKLHDRSRATTHRTVTAANIADSNQKTQ